jgi:MYXO-CTERM domain-containing protein
MDNSGAATTLNLSYASFNTWHIQGSHPGTDANGSYNKELLNGYLNSGPAAWGPGITNSSVSLSQIPYGLYDVYIYFSSDTAGRNGSVSDGSTTYYFSTLGAAEIGGANALLTQTTDTIGTNPGADYALFSGLTGASQTITMDMLSGNDQWGGIAGFQVVAVPEPDTLALAALGGLGAVLFHRRR